MLDHTPANKDQLLLYTISAINQSSVNQAINQSVIACNGPNLFQTSAVTHVINWHQPQASTLLVKAEFHLQFIMCPHRSNQFMPVSR